MPANSSCDLPLMRVGRPGQLGVEALGPTVVQWQHVVLHRLDQEQALQLMQPLRHLLGKIVGLRPVVRGVQLPNVVVVGRHLHRSPRQAVPRHRRPALVVDAAVDPHLEVLGGRAGRGALASSKE